MAAGADDGAPDWQEYVAEALDRALSALARSDEPAAQLAACSDLRAVAERGIARAHAERFASGGGVARLTRLLRSADPELVDAASEALACITSVSRSSGRPPRVLRFVATPPGGHPAAPIEPVPIEVSIRTLDSGEAGTGYDVWSSALVLCRWLCSVEGLARTRLLDAPAVSVLELGAGVGSVGLVAAKLIASCAARGAAGSEAGGARGAGGDEAAPPSGGTGGRGGAAVALAGAEVVLTDNQPAVLRALELAIAGNGLADASTAGGTGGSRSADASVAAPAAAANGLADASTAAPAAAARSAHAAAVAARAAPPAGAPPARRLSPRVRVRAARLDWAVEAGMPARVPELDPSVMPGQARGSAAEEAAAGGAEAGAGVPTVDASARFDVVLGSDVCYERDHAELVARTAARHVSAGGRLALSMTVRSLELRAGLTAALAERFDDVRVEQAETDGLGIVEGGTTMHASHYVGGISVITATGRGD